jgi:hypothetical protein
MYFTPKTDSQYKLAITTEDGRPCPYLYADDDPLDKVAKRCKALHMIRQDLHAAIELTEAMQSAQSPSIISDAIWHAAIMSYGRCFANADGRGITLNIKDVRAFNPAAESFHKQMIGLRNEYVAHAGNHGEGFVKVVVTLAPDTDPKAVQGVTYLDVRKNGAGVEEIKFFRALCEGIDTIVMAKQTNLVEHLVADYQKKDINALYSKAYT